jgi:cytochrome c oxidase cbb3-type subunit 3
MRQRTPGRILIPAVLIAIIWILMMVNPIGFERTSGIGGFFKDGFRHLFETLTDITSIAILVVSFIMLLIVNTLNKIIENNKFEKLSPEEQQEYIEVSKQGYFSRLLRSSKERQSEEEEEALAIDHGYDGIIELDNSLPDWWLGLFYFGVIFAVVYLLAFAFTDFADPIAEYEEHNAIAEAKVATWIANNDITIDEAENKYTDSQAIDNGKKLFEQVCATCHTANGGGGIGPNLTDDYWINHSEGDLFKNIYQMVYNGSPNDPSMRAFGQKGELTGLAIQDIASYVYYMNQELPPITQAEGGAAPKGDKISKWARKK